MHINASDALDKLRFLSVTEPSLLGDAVELQIRIKPDPENGTITITDAIGMTKEELIDCLGTIAQSGTSKFLTALKENKDLGADNGLIGQFGVGFYSAFLVADKVVVSTKSPKSDKQYVWESAAESSSYVIRVETDPENIISRGTQIKLYLRPDDKYDCQTAMNKLAQEVNNMQGHPPGFPCKDVAASLHKDPPPEAETSKRAATRPRTAPHVPWEALDSTSSDSTSSDSQGSEEVDDQVEQATQPLKPPPHHQLSTYKDPVPTQNPITISMDRLIPAYRCPTTLEYNQDKV
ncbi:heat shock protein 90-5, chloroplastic-like [Rosa rugosa]|uniref:heat shock protein 90-5, chloroplastic-like n=1 Tax=Rosa rugosa TaxID=74645 RepID=UPI002B40FADC|nr:heat shock protein 90-5, chloroplastic-like [Rosa rugosa]